MAETMEINNKRYKVCVIGYTVVGLALFLFVHAHNVFPQLLLARLFFSVGGAATSTMVTAILPSMTAFEAKALPGAGKPSQGSQPPRGHLVSPSISSQLTVTPARLYRQTSQKSEPKRATLLNTSPTRLAGFVGFFTGCGALLALGLFLPLPTRFQEAGIAKGQAVADSYYVVGTVSITVAVACFFGLRRLKGEESKGWRKALNVQASSQLDLDAGSRLPYWSLLLKSFGLGYRHKVLGLGYLGGFVARASSVGISLFIPLFVNSYFISSGLCDGSIHDDAKERCRRAYILAAELTGASQLVALIFAPIFGYLADRYRRFNIPLLTAAIAGILGYVGFAVLKSPEPTGINGTPLIFVIVSLLGISQIGAIVCSLGLLGRGILMVESRADTPGSNGPNRNGDYEHYGSTHDASLSPHPNSRPLRDAGIVNDNENEETQGLLRENTPNNQSLAHMKGSIAGVYSLAGGAGILLLTKLGGVLFDKVSPVAPFYMLAAFNGLLLLTGVAYGLSSTSTDDQSS